MDCLSFFYSMSTISPRTWASGLAFLFSFKLSVHPCIPFCEQNLMTGSYSSVTQAAKPPVQPRGYISVRRRHRRWAALLVNCRRCHTLNSMYLALNSAFCYNLPCLQFLSANLVPLICEMVIETNRYAFEMPQRAGEWWFLDLLYVTVKEHTFVRIHGILLPIAWKSQKPLRCSSVATEFISNGVLTSDSMTLIVAQLHKHNRKC